jgi:hypothetical protein
MSSIYEERVSEARQTERNILQEGLCRSVFGKACRAIWPVKTAEHLAALVGCSVRTAAYQLSGEHDPSAESVLIVMNAIVPKRKRK